MLREPYERAGPFGKRDAIRLVVAVLLIVVALAVGVPGDFAPVSPGYAVGVVASSAIIAPRDGVVPNSVETAAAKVAAAAKAQPQYDFSSDRATLIASVQVADLQLALKPLDAAFATSKTPEALRAALQMALPTALPLLSSDGRTMLLTLDSTRWAPVEHAAEGSVYAGEQTEIRDVELAARLPSLAITYILAGSGLSGTEQQLAAAIATPFFVANSTYSATLTDQARTAAADAQGTVSDSINAGGLIVAEGQRLTESDMIKIRFFGLDKSTADWSRAAAWMLLGTVVAVLMLCWLWRFRPEYWARSRTLALIGLIFVLAVLAMKLSGGHAWIPYAIPAAAVGILLTLLLDSGIGIVAVAVLAILAGPVSGSSVEMTAYIFLGGFAGILAIRKGERQHLFVQAGLAVAAADVAVIGAFALLGQYDMTGMLQLWGVAAASALLATIISLGSFSLLGNLFGILTGSQLLELANPSQPLLRRLLIETPGTYHHSLMVGNLGERAASGVGADPLLVRAAAYYHDIGKLVNPLAFIENQASGENIHDHLDPADSATILRQHVSDGVSLARKAGLPDSLIAFIPQHHGTAILSFVYGKARDEAAEAAGGMNTAAGKAAADAVDQRLYRHSGPKPQSREAAILMLSDGVEASVRSLSSRDEATIRAMVDHILRERLNDGQLNECDLTIRDLENIREAFVGQLLGMYHQRIAYPQNKVVESGVQRDNSQR